MLLKPAAPELNLEHLAPWAGLAVEGGGVDVALVGIAYDRAATYRAGAALAPERLRRLSRAFPPVSDVGEDLSSLRMLDAGDLIAADMAADWPVLRDRLLEMADARSYIVVGGDHSVAIPSLAAQQARHGARLAVLYVDAHPDLCDVSRGSPFTHGCALRRGIELSPIDPRRVMVLACRDFDAEEVAYAAASGVTLITMAEVARDGIARAAERVREWLPRDAKLHISFDIDALDPAHAPGTTLPAPGGLTTREGLTLLQLLRGSDLCGFDLVEVNPPADTDDITSLAALKLIFQFLALQARVA